VNVKNFYSSVSFGIGLSAEVYLSSDCRWWWGDWISFFHYSLLHSSLNWRQSTKLKRCFFLLGYIS